MIREALIKKLEGEVAALEADLQTFLNSPTRAIPDHINYVETAEKKLGELSSTKGKLVTLKRVKEAE